MIRLHITKTSKGYGKQEKYTCFEETSKVFENMANAKNWLNQEYGKCKKVNLYIDLENGKTIKNGYIYCFKNSDYSHYPVENWLEQHWISFQNLENISI